MENKFAEAMSKRTNVELINILNSPDGDYVPEAMEAARAEFDKRKLSKQQLVVAAQEIEEKKQLDETKANEPLSSNRKWLAIVLPGRGFLRYVIYNSEGYHRKAKELKTYTLYGVIMWVCIILLFYLMS